MPIYSVTLKGLYAGQNVINVLWYRAVTLWGDLGTLLGAQAALCAEVKQEIWDSRSPGHIGGYGMEERALTGYTLSSIDCAAYDDEAVLLSTSPYTLVVNEPGLNNAASNGPAPAAIFKANLEPAFGPGLFLPKRGYIAFGPIADNAIENDGSLNAAEVVIMQTIANHMADNIVTESPIETFFPVRVRVTRVGGLITELGYRDVSGFVVKPIASFRRSRLPEAG